MQRSRSTISACRSPSEPRPPSIATFLGIGYGPLSDSGAYSKETRTFGCEPRTTVIGIPIGPPSQRPEPKSACMWSPAPIAATIRSESGATGSLSTRWFQAFVAGKTGHAAAPGSRDAEAAPTASRQSRARAAAGLTPHTLGGGHDVRVPYSGGSVTAG